MTQEERYIELLAAEANRHCAMAQITTEPALKSAHLDVSLACWAGVAALRREVGPWSSARRGRLYRLLFIRKFPAWTRTQERHIRDR